MPRSLDWTVMIYMTGFMKDMPNLVRQKLDDIRSVPLTDNVKIAVFAKYNDEQNNGALVCQQLMMGKPGQGETCVPLAPDTDAGRDGTLKTFIEWSRSVAAADREALVIYSHGSGWQPSELDDIYAEEVKLATITNPPHPGAGGPGEPLEIPHEELVKWSQGEIGQVIFRDTIAKLVRMRMFTPTMTALALDEGSGHCLDTLELRNVLAWAHSKALKPFELFGMDACLMSNLEVGFECSEDALFMVGSEGTEQPNGWPLHKILPRLVSHSEMDGGELGTIIVNEYAESCDRRIGYFTQSAVELKNIRKLKEPLNALAEVLTTHLTQAKSAQDKCATFSYHYYQLADLESFCRKLSGKRATEPVKSTATAVIDELARHVVANAHGGPETKGCGGVTIYFPPPSHPIPGAYGDLLFAQQTSWYDFLKAYAAWSPPTS